MLERECEQAGLTLAQYRLLDFVRTEPVRAGALAAKAAISRPSLTTIMDTLEARGFIQRDRVPGDRRGVTLELTHDGLKVLCLAEEGFARKLSEVVAPTEVKTVLAGISTLRDGLIRFATATAAAQPVEPVEAGVSVDAAGPVESVKA